MQKKYNLALEKIEKALKLAPGGSELWKYLQNRREYVLHATGGKQQSDADQTLP
jgi:hypothetical protein